MKKILSLFLGVMLSFSMMGVFAEESQNFLKNGGFESFEENLPTAWTVPVGTPGKDIAASNKAMEGKTSLRLFGTSDNAFVSGEIEGLRQGAKYTLSFYVLRTYGEDITNRIEFSYMDNGAKKYITENAAITKLGETDEGKWVQKIIDFTVPPKAETTIISFRKVGEADVCFDGASVFGGSESGELDVTQETGTWTPKVIENSENMISNPSMEDVENNYPKDWARFSNQKVFLNTEKEYARTGNNSIKIATNDTTLPWAKFSINEDVIPGSEVTFSAWFFSPNLAERVGFKTEYYVTNYDHVILTGDGGKTLSKVADGDGWVQLTFSQVVPDNTDSIHLFARMYGTGEVYVDDVEVKVTKGPEAFTTFLTDEVYYYSEWEGAGKATVNANTDFYPEFIGMPLHFTVQDKEMVLYEETIPMHESGATTFEFPLDTLAEKLKEYIIRVKLHDHEGNYIAEKEDTVYKVDRPKYITEEGYYVENGKQFDPVYVYHIGSNEKDFTLATEAGINMIQGYPREESLDLLAEFDMKAFVVLYSGGSSGQSAGHPSKIGAALENVQRFKDHPAVFGWALMDEPTSTAWEDLKRAYIEIRKIDPNHPIFITMNSNHATTGRFTDTISSDSYPYGLRPFTYADYDTIAEVIDVTDNRKPVYDLLQAFDYRNSFPTEQEIRNMMYQNFWAGAEGIGFYTWSDCQIDENGNEVPIYNTRLWEPLKSFMNLEYEEVRDHFVYKKYPTFNEVRKEDYWYRSWVKDGKLSLVILNRKDKENTEAAIELTSADKSVKVENFEGTVIYGSENKQISGTDGTFKVTLTPGQAILYTINVDKDLSGIVSSGFFDMYEHGWAEKAVKTLNEKDILHTNGHKFYPGENVTRADFAYMLMRALDIPEGEAEAFSDIRSFDYFADEIANGRAAGLLNGMGDNTFGSALPITRQDIMVMCVRAAEHIGKLGNAEAKDLAAFSDGALVSDYAMEAVSKMVGAGLIVGNADGTVNPQGNATRAEAAVIIDRLISLE